MGTNEKMLIEILCSRTNQQILAIKAAYQQMYNRDLENDIKSETSGHFERLLVSMCCGRLQLAFLSFSTPHNLLKDSGFLTAAA